MNLFSTFVSVDGVSIGRNSYCTSTVCISDRGPPITQNPHTSDDGWTAVGRAPKTIVDPSRMKLTKQPMDENFQLGPGGKAMSAWHRGSNGGAKAQESEKPTSTPNRSVLSCPMSFWSALSIIYWQENLFC